MLNFSPKHKLGWSDFCLSDFSIIAPACIGKIQGLEQCYLFDLEVKNKTLALMFKFIVAFFSMPMSTHFSLGCWLIFLTNRIFG